MCGIFGYFNLDRESTEDDCILKMGQKSLNIEAQMMKVNLFLMEFYLEIEGFRLLILRSENNLFIQMIKNCIGSKWRNL